MVGQQRLVPFVNHLVRESELNMARKKSILKNTHRGATDTVGHAEAQGSAGEKHYSSRQMTATKGRGKRHGTHRGSKRA